MAAHTWVPVDADTDSWELQIRYVNELGEEFIHAVVAARGEREMCWSQCCGDWPGCKATCPVCSERLRDVEYG